MTMRDLIPWRRPSSPLATTDWPPMFSLHRDMNRMFEDFFSNGGGLLAGASQQFPELEINETEKYVDVSAEIPGMTEKDVKVSISNDGEMLTIEGEKKSEKETTSENLYCAERRYGRFRRSVTLPSVVDASGVEATCKDGVLKVHMARLPEKHQQAKQIPVKRM